MIDFRAHVALLIITAICAFFIGVASVLVGPPSDFCVQTGGEHD